MRLLAAFGLICLVPAFSFALGSETKAIQAFKSAPAVAPAITLLQTEDPTLVPGAITAVAIEGGCGFAGCDTTYLVVQELTHHGTNTYFRSISAIVRVPAVGVTSVQIAKITN